MFNEYHPHVFPRNSFAKIQKSGVYRIHKTKLRKQKLYIKATHYFLSMPQSIPIFRKTDHFWLKPALEFILENILFWSEKEICT